MVDELTRHEETGTSRTVYNKGFPVAVLRDAIAKVEWPEVATTAAVTQDSREAIFASRRKPRWAT